MALQTDLGLRVPMRCSARINILISTHLFSMEVNRLIMILTNPMRNDSYLQVEGLHSSEARHLCCGLAFAQEHKRYRK